ncbi:MAG: M67 family metallopeptidase, partial [Methylococcales bacterium]
CYPVNNIAERPALRFLMDPAQQIDAMRNIRENHEDLFAIYHSHPTAPAEPSATDLEQASYPDALQIIISLNTQGVLEMRGFRYRPRGHIEEIVVGIRNG